MNRFPRPVLLVSKCLGFAACRYDGRVIQDDFVARLRRLARLIPVCPEVEIGLGVPRDKIRLVGSGPQRRLVQPATGRDLTETMRKFSSGFLDGMGEDSVDGVILKSRSPSCGIGDCRVFDDWVTEEASDRGQGLFARTVAEMWPDVPVEDEVRLARPTVRIDFLTHVYARARNREPRRTETEVEPGIPRELLEG
jgi:uncharacterized protein YbbK (DUF523 family)